MLTPLAAWKAPSTTTPGKYQLQVKEAPKLAIPALEEAIRRDPKSPAKVHLLLALAYYRQMNYPQAERKLRDLLAKWPAHAQARLLLKRVQQDQDRLMRARF